MFSCRLIKFKDDVVLGDSDIYKDVNDLWDTFHRSKRSTEKLSSDLSGIIGFYVSSLFFSIVLQGLAVFKFEGEWFSLIYLVANTVTLLFVIYESQTLKFEFEDLTENLCHLKTSSVLGRVLRLSVFLFINLLSFFFQYHYYHHHYHHHFVLIFYLTSYVLICCHL